VEAFQKRGHPEQGYGYKPDNRHLLGAPVRKDAAKLLGSVPVPTSDCGLDEDAIRALGILDQGGAPFCVSHGWSGALRDNQQRNGVASPRLASRLWLMYLMHAIEGDVGGFDGAIVGDGATVIEQLGFPPEDAWPYSDSESGNFKVRPPADVERQAFDRIAPFDYGRILSGGSGRVDDVLRALSAGGKGGKPCPVVFGTNVTNAFASNQLGTDFVVDAPTGDIDGGHCMRIVRAVRDPGVVGGWRFRVVNSWSKTWGDGGMFWMTPAYLMDPATSDLWMSDFQGVQA
jgi:hypothetical protein